MKKIIPVLLITLLASCGRKQKNFFDFPTTKQEPKIKRLSLGFVKNVKVKQTKNGNKITWEKPIKKSDKVAGYNLYRLVNCSFIPKKPINKNLIQETYFLDKKIFNSENKISKKFCYVIKTVFKVRDKYLEGPCSQVIYLK